VSKAKDLSRGALPHEIVRCAQDDCLTILFRLLLLEMDDQAVLSADRAAAD